MTTSEKFKTIASYQSDNFKKWFGDMPFKKGEVITTSKKLPRDMNDKEILSEFRPEYVSLGDVYATLDEGGKDIWYLFYCKDFIGVLRTVFVNWHGGGWHVSAYSVEGPGGWGGGYQVFARNFDTQTLDTSDSALGTLATWELEYELVGKVWKSKNTGELKITLK